MNNIKDIPVPETPMDMIPADHITILHAAKLAFMLIILSGEAPSVAFRRAFDLRYGMNGLYDLGYSRRQVIEILDDSCAKAEMAEEIY